MENPAQLNLIAIEEFIEKAKKAGYRFGKGNPKNRLRYLTKTGVLPHAVRFQAKETDAHTTGFYPESAVQILLSAQKLKKQEKLSAEKIADHVEPMLRGVQRGALQESLVTTLRPERLRSTPRLFLPAVVGAAVFLVVLSQTVFGKMLGERMVGGLRAALFPEEAIRQLVREAEGLEGREGREGKVLAEEDLDFTSSLLSLSHLVTSSPNLLKNSSFESAGSTAPAGFWQFHPNSTDGNTQRSSHAARSGSYSLLITADTGGVLQEATKTEANRSYTLGVWVKILGESKGPTLPRQGRTLSDTKLHLALGPGWDKSFELDSVQPDQPQKVSPFEARDGWRYYSAVFENPPPGLVPRIYVETDKSYNSYKNYNTSGEIFIFLDDAGMAETWSVNQLAGAETDNGYKDYKNYNISGAYLESGFQTLVPAGGNVLSVTADGILYPTDDSQTQGGLGTDANRFGKTWLSNADLSENLSINGKLDLSGKLTANGNLVLGNNDGDEIEVGGRFTSDLLPKQSNAVSLGTSGNRWNNLFVAAANLSNNLTVSGSATVTGALTVSGGLTMSGGSGLSVTGDLSLDGDLDFTGPQNVTTTSDNLTVSPTGNLLIDTSGGTVSIRDAAIDLTNQPTTVSGSTLSLRSTGTFIIDTSANNTNVDVQTGTANFQVNSTQFVVDGNGSITLAPSNSQVTITGNVDVSNGLDVTNGLTVNGTSSLGDGGTTNYLSVSSTGDMTFLGSANNLIANNDLVIRAGNSLTLDTSASNNNLVINTGSGTLNASVGAFTLTTSSYTQTTNGAVNRTVGGTVTDRITGANNYVLRVGNAADDSNADGNDIFIAAVDQITLRSASFSQTTSGNTEMIVSAGDYSVLVQGNNDLYLRGGGAGRDNATNGGDLQLAAQDSLIVDAGDIAITSSEDSTYPIILRSAAGGIQLSTQSADNGNLTLYSAGTLTLDTSGNNTNILILPGSGRIGVGTTAPATAFHISASDGLIIPVGSTAQRAGTPTTGTIRYNSQTSQFEGYSDSSWGSLGGVIDVDQDTYVSAETSAGADNDDLRFITAGTQRMMIDETGNIGIGPGPGSVLPAGILDVIGNAPIILRAGQSALNNSTSGSTSTTADLQLAAADQLLATAGALTFLASNDASYPLLLRSSQGGIQLSSQSQDNGGILISAAGNLYIDTSFYGTTTYLQGGLVRVGSGGTVNNVSGNGALYVQGNLEVDGSVWLGDISSDDLTLTGQIGSNLIPSVGSTYTLGNTTNRWAEIWGDTLTVTTLNSSANNITGITSNSFTIDTSNTTADTQDISITFERGTPATNSQFLWDASEKYFSLNAAFNISPDTDITTLAGEHAILNVNDSYGGRRLATFSEAGTRRAVIDSSGNILLYQASAIETSAGTLTMRGYSGLTLTTSSASTGEIRVISRGTLQLDTSTNNDNILVRTGTGNLNVSSNQLYLTGNLVVTGTETFNGRSYTFPGSETASGILLTDGSGVLSWTTIGQASVTADSLDFAQFQDELDLDADTTVNGDQSLVIRTGLGSIQNSTSGSNDLQLSAEDKLILGAASFDLSTSSGGIDIISDSRIDLSGRGTLTLDTSQSNANIVLTPGTGNVGIGSTAPGYKLDVNGTLRTTSTARVEGALTVTTGGASVTGDLTLDGDLDFTGPQNITTTADDLTLSPTGNLRIDTTGGTVKVSDTLEIGDGGVTNYASFSTTGDMTLYGAANNLIANNDLVIRSGNSLTIDTSANNTNLVLQGGTGGLTGSFGTINLTAATDSVSAVYLNSQRGGITLSSSNASGSGPIRILSGGSLQLSTSQGNQPIYLQAGTGNVNVSSTQLYLTGNLVVTGTETFNGVAYTFPGADTANGALISNGSGVLSWATIGGSNVTNDSLDFAQFDDSLDLDADTSINGPYSFIVRAGNAARQNAASGNNDLQLSAEDQIMIDSAGLTLATSNADAVLEINGDNDLVMRAGDAAAESTANNNDIFLASEDDTILRADTFNLTVSGADAASIALRSTTGGIDLSTGTNSGLGTAAMTLRAGGTLTLDTSANNTNILIDSGTGDLTAQIGSGNIVAEDDATSALIFRASAGGIQLSTQSADNGNLTLYSAGTLTLDTSRNNTNIQLSAGTGTLNVSAATARLTGNLIVTGTETFNGVTYTFPGTQTANGVLLTDGSGVLSWTTGLTGASLADDTLDFVDFQDELDLDADTSINGDYSLIVRAGLGAVQNSTSGSNDLQLAAEDRLDLYAASYSLTTSGNSVDILSGGRIDLSAKGTLTLDTSQNNSNILMKTGSGNINVSTGTLTITGLLDIRDSTGTLALATDANGNIGIGTTSPGGILDVLGQCVARGTRIRLRRRRRKKSSHKRSHLLWLWEELELPIEDVKPGDEVLTLDEQTGKFVWQKVNRLMDKGIKSIVKLTTESGKTIKTTSEHPYLVQTEVGGRRSEVGKLKFAFVDETGVTLDPEQKHFGVGCLVTAKNELAINQKLRDIFLEAINKLNQKDKQELFEFKFKYITPASLPYYKKMLNVLKQYINDWDFAYAIEVRKNKKFWNQYLDMVEEVFAGAPGEYIVIADHLNKPKRAARGLSDLKKTTPIIKSLQMESQGTMFLQLTDVLLGSIAYVLSKGKDEYKNEIAKETMNLLQQKRAGIDPIYAARTRVTQVTCSPSKTEYSTTIDSLSSIGYKAAPRTDRRSGTGVTLYRLDAVMALSPCRNKKNISPAVPLVKGMNWAKVRNLKVGDRVATIDGWERISKIEKLPAEQVYDLEIEATHNFVAGHYVNRRTGKALTAEQEELLAEYKKALVAEGSFASVEDSLKKESPLSARIEPSITDFNLLSSLGSRRRDLHPHPLTDKEGIPLYELRRHAAPSDLILSRLKKAGVNPEDVYFGGIVAHNTTSIAMRAGQSTLEASNLGTSSTTADIQLYAADSMLASVGDLTLQASEDSTYPIILRSAQGGIQLSTQSADNGNLTLYSAGTLTLDSSRNNTNILLLPGTGNIGIGSTAPGYKLDVNGTLRTTSTARVEGALTVTTGGASVTGDLTLDGDLDFTGAQNITTTADNLTLSPTGNLIIDTSGGTLSIRDGTIDLTNQPTTLSASTLTLRSTGNFILDTSASNTNLVLQAGTGGLTGSFGTINLTAINDSVSAVYLNSQRGGITLSSSNASGSGPIRILAGGSLQLSTSQGNQPIYLQAGTGNVNVSSTQLYLTGNLVVTGTETFNGVTYTFPGADGSASNVLTTSGTGLLSWGTLGAASITADSLDFTEFQDSLDLDADTSINGPYSFIIRTGNAARQNATSGNNDLQLSAEDQILIDSAGLTLSTSNGDATFRAAGDNDLVLRAGDAAAESTANNNDIFIAAEDDMILRADTFNLTVSGADAASIALRSTTGGIDLSTGTNSGLGTANLTLRSGGTLTLDTSANNTNILIDSGTGDLTVQTGTGSIVAEDDVPSALIFRASAGGIQLSTQSSDNGNLTLYSAGTLTLDSSRNSTNVLILPGSGNVGIGSTAPGYKLDVNGTLRTSSTARVEGALTVTTGGASVTGDLTLDGDLDFTGAQNITTTADNLTVSPTGNLILDSSGGLVSVRDGVEIQGARTGKALVTVDETGDQDILTASKSGTPRFTVTRDGNIKLHQASTIYTTIGDLTLSTTSGSNDDIVIRTYDSAASTANGDDIFIAAQDNLYLGASALTLETTSASAGQLVIRSDGTLQLDTSANNTNLVVNTGSGNIDLNFTGELQIDGGLTDIGSGTYTLANGDNDLGVEGDVEVNGNLQVDGTITGATAFNCTDCINFDDLADELNLDADTTVNGDQSLVIRTGLGARQNATSGNNDLQLSAEDQIMIDSAGLTLATSNGDAALEINGDNDLVMRAGDAAAESTANNNDIFIASEDDTILRADTFNLTVSGADAASIALRSTTGGIDLSTGTNSGLGAANLTLRSGGTLTLDSSANNTNILIDSGTGDLTAQIGTGNIVAEDDATSALIFRASAGGIQLSTQSADNGNLTLYSAGTLTLDSSRNNTNIILSPGTGNVGIGTTAPNNKLSVAGTAFLGGSSTGLNINAGAVTSAYAPGQAGDNEIPITINAIGTNTTSLNLQTGGSNRIKIDANGNVGVGTSTPGGILDVVGDYSIIMRAGLGAVQNSTSGNNDIQLAAEDRLDLFATSYSLTTSGNSVDILSAGRIDLSAKGTLTLDTSNADANINVYSGGTGVNAMLLRAVNGGIQLSTGGGGTGEMRLLSSGTMTLGTSATNANILLLPGTGNVGIGTTGPDMKLTVAGDANISDGYGLVIGNTAQIISLVNFGYTPEFQVLGNARHDSSGVFGQFSADAEGPTLVFYKSRSATVGTKSVTSVGDLLGQLAFTGTNSNSASGYDGAYIRAYQDAAATTTYTPSRLSFWTSAGSTVAERMTIKNDGNVGIGTTSPLGKLDIQGDSGILLKAGAAAISLSSGTTSSSDLQLAAADRIDLFAGSMTLSTSSRTAGELRLTSSGSLILDTSGAAGGGAPIRLQAGTGNVQVSSSQLYLTGNLVVTGTETFNGVAYTFPGADGSASNVLTTSGTGLLSWGTLGAASITADSLDFTEFKDEMTLDADTTVNGDQSLIIRAGLGARQNATSGSNDLQLAAEDAMIVDADDFTLTTSNTGVSSMQLISKGTFRIDTSTNNNNILLLPGTGNVGIGTTVPNVKLEVFGGGTGAVTATDIDTESAIRIKGKATSGVSTWIGALATDTQYIQAGAYNGSTLNDLVINPFGGNVGIGTTGPLGILDVLGSCVTGDTLLPIRRRRRRKKYADSGDPLPTLPEVEGEVPADVFESEFMLCRIDEVMPGDEVLSLNEATGALEYSRINTLKDMGVKEVYELVTKSGRVIRTTAEHPYLVEMINDGGNI